MKLFEPQVLIIILVIALLIFGPKQLPALGKMFGKTAKEFREGVADMTEDVKATQESVENVAKPAESAVSAPAEAADASTAAEPEAPAKV
ncbi:MAG: twin-arginine translocase TatA/TatE family subunit [Coriobacteriia bacterium]|nr:twin-arginine translocase TatA/TatE family subunit [Coriobacteriia bacterium]